MSGTRRRGLVRYGADWIPIAWVQVTLALSLLPWVLHLPLWALALGAVPVFWLRSSGAYIQHNQGHLAAFWSGPLNFVYDIELALMTGYVTPLWELQHSRGHHRHYLTPADDSASIVDGTTGRPMPRWRYCLIGNVTIIQDSWRIAKEEIAAGRADLRGKLVAQCVVASALAGLLCYANWFDFVSFILLPDIVLSWAVWHVAYDHHLDVPGETHYDGSNNHFERAFNLTTFNIGHHTAHHEKPTLHWSLLPKRSAELLGRLHPATVHGELDARSLERA
jgi:beta-carotene hydroxylase